MLGCDAVALWRCTQAFRLLGRAFVSMQQDRSRVCSDSVSHHNPDGIAVAEACMACKHEIMLLSHSDPTTLVDCGGKHAEGPNNRKDWLGTIQI